MAAPGASAAQRKKAADDAKAALAKALLGDTSDTEDNKSASLPEESSDSSDTDISQAEKRRKKRKKKLDVGKKRGEP